MVITSLDAANTHFLNDINVKIQFTFGQANRRCTDCAADLQCQMTGTAAHDLNHRAALMRLHGIAQLVDALDRGVACGIKTDRVIRAHNVIVNRAGHADAGHTLVGQCLRTAERTVATAADQAVDAQIFAGIRSLL